MIKIIVDLGLLIVIVLLFVNERLWLKKQDERVERTLKRLDQTIDKLKHKHA